MGITVDERFHPDLTEAVRRLVEHFQPERIYLFGSRARGDHREDSDYDILVVVRESGEPYLDRMRTASRLIRDLLVPTQVVVVTIEEFERDAPVVSSLPDRVSHEGLILYAA